MKSKSNNAADRRSINWKRVGLRLAAMILLIVFLASECATLIPVE